MLNEKGFIAIVALGIFLLLSVFGIIIQDLTTNTVNSIRDTNQYYEARDLADSVMEYIRYELNEKEAGYNYSPSVCVYGDFADSNGTQNEPICDQILEEAGILNEGVSSKDIKITLNIKGRNEEEEKFTGNCSNTFYNGCYVVPLAGTGNAGERCELYTPDFSGESSAEKLVDDKGQIITDTANEGIKQIDYSCNWNRLTFGSSVTDRAVIPFYYQDGEEIINPYFNDPTTPQNEAIATKFVIRMRTPCIPNANTTGEDPTICSDSERYVLDEEENDIVVQWQISGTCVDREGNEEECGLIQRVDLENPEDSSAITESRINDGDNGLVFLTKEIFYHDSIGVDTNTENTVPVEIRNYFKKIKNPVLTLFLGDNLISTNGENIPYLEYQVLTEHPVSNSSTLAEVEINVDGIVFKKTLSKEEQKPLIDFAVQN